MIFIMSASAQFSVIFCLFELRIPPENTSAALTLATTFGTTAATLVPYIAIAGHPTTMLLPGLFGALNFGMGFLLPLPGKFLPKAVSLSANVTWLKMDNVNQIVNDTIPDSALGHGTSFDLTYYERINNVQRPRLNESNIDPSLLIDDEDDDDKGGRAHDRSYSRIIKNWDWDLHTSNMLPKADDVEISMLYKYIEATNLQPILEKEV